MPIRADIAGLRRNLQTYRIQSPQFPSTMHRLFFMHKCLGPPVALTGWIFQSQNQMQLMSDHSGSMPERFIPKQTVPVDDPKLTYLIRSYCSKISLTSIAKP